MYDENDFVQYYQQYRDNSSVNYVFVSNLTRHKNLPQGIIRIARTLFNTGLKNGDMSDLIIYLAENGVNNQNAQFIIDKAMKQKDLVEDLPPDLITPEEMLRIITIANLGDFTMPEALPINFVQDMMGFIQNSTVPHHLQIHFAEWQVKMAKRWPVMWMAWLIYITDAYVSPEPDVWETLKELFTQADKTVAQSYHNECSYLDHPDQSEYDSLANSNQYIG